VHPFFCLFSYFIEGIKHKGIRQVFAVIGIWDKFFLRIVFFVYSTDLQPRMEAARHAAGRLLLLRRGGGGATSHRSRSSCACRQVTYSGQPVKAAKNY